MAAVSKATNKSKFQTGDVPTESDFIDLIDSYTDAAHASDTANPHSVTKSQVGLGSADSERCFGAPTVAFISSSKRGRTSPQNLTITRPSVGSGKVSGKSVM